MFKLTSLLAWRKTAARAVEDSLDTFASESALRPHPVDHAARWRYAGPLALIGLVSAGAAGAYLLNQTERLSAAVPSASLTIESDPLGAVVTAGGVRKGETPLTLAVPPGEYAFEVLHGERRKELRVVARAETAVVHHVQFDLAPPEEKKAPDVPALPPEIRKAAPVAVVSRGPAAGWLAVTSHIPLHVLEKSQVIGSTAAAKIMLPAGKRELHLVNESLGFSARRVVQIGAGRTTALAIAVPRARVSINALPWAEVWIDGVRAGETPIGNRMVGLGSREIVFRHPTLGERRQTVVVSLKAPVRVSVDMRKSQ